MFGTKDKNYQICYNLMRIESNRAPSTELQSALDKLYPSRINSFFGALDRISAYLFPRPGEQAVRDILRERALRQQKRFEFD